MAGAHEHHVEVVVFVGQEVFAGGLQPARLRAALHHVGDARRAVVATRLGAQRHRADVCRTGVLVQVARGAGNVREVRQQRHWR